MHDIDIIDKSLIEFDTEILNSLMYQGNNYYVLHDAPYLADLEDTDVAATFVIHPYKDQQLALDHFVNINSGLSPMLCDEGHDGIIDASKGVDFLRFYISDQYLQF